MVFVSNDVQLSDSWVFLLYAGFYTIIIVRISVSTWLIQTPVGVTGDDAQGFLVDDLGCGAGASSTENQPISLSEHPTLSINSRRTAFIFAVYYGKTSMLLRSSGSPTGYSCSSTHFSP